MTTYIRIQRKCKGNTATPNTVQYINIHDIPDHVCIIYACTAGLL